MLVYTKHDHYNVYTSGFDINMAVIRRKSQIFQSFFLHFSNTVASNRHSLIEFFFFCGGGVGDVVKILAVSTVQTVRLVVLLKQT